MVSGLHFVEDLFIGIGIAMLFGAFVLACMESRHGRDVDELRGWLSARFSVLGAIPVTMILVQSLRWFRDAVDNVVSELMTDFELSSFSAPIIMSLLAVILPVAAAFNAVLGGSAFLFFVYLLVAIGIFVLGVFQQSASSEKWLGVMSAALTLSWLVFAPIYAVHSLTDHILLGTFSHSVLASIFVAALLYAGCAGVWLIYRSYRDVRALGQFDRALARFLFAVPLVYMLYWFGLLSGHFATYTPSPPREWLALISVVIVGSVSFAATLSAIDAGVAEDRRGHGLAVFLAALVLSMSGVVANSSLIANEFPFWLRLFSPNFGLHDIVLDSRFWISHSPFFLWFMMLLGGLFGVMGKLTTISWPSSMGGAVSRPFIALSIVCTLSGMLVLCVGSIVDVYVNVK